MMDIGLMIRQMGMVCL
jgi:hypothetical protein